jgi:hypothetical protein
MRMFVRFVELDETKDRVLSHSNISKALESLTLLETQMNIKVGWQFW